jgi:uncharacterized membrane protein
MNWLVLALLSAVIYSIIKFGDKYIVSKIIKDYVCIPVYCGIIGGVIGGVILPFISLDNMSIGHILMSLIPGILIIAFGPLYFRAISLEDVSRIIIYMQLTPVIALAMSSLFLKEWISLSQFIGFIIIIISVVFAAMNKNKNRISSAFFYILALDTIIAGSSIIQKYLILKHTVYPVMALNFVGYFIGSILLLALIPRVRSAFISSIRTINISGISIIILNESLFIIAQLIAIAAISLGPVALVVVIGSTQLFYGIFIGLVLTIIMPSVYNENIEKREIIRKIGLSGIAFYGIYLLS